LTHFLKKFRISSCEKGTFEEKLEESSGFLRVEGEV